MWQLYFLVFFDMFPIAKSNKVVSLQSVIGCYYNMRQVLQSLTDCYDKVRQVLQSVADVITKCTRYYKVWQFLQSET